MSGTDAFTPSADLRALTQRALESFEAIPELVAARDAAPATLRESLQRVFACSDFIAQSCARDARLFPKLIADGDLERRLAHADFIARAPALPATLPEPEVMSLLRQWRKRELVRIAWRDLAGWADLEETLADLSCFADSAIGAAHDYARQTLVQRYGEPRSQSGVSQPLVVLGMGKLGGGELNFSSDIDLVLLFPEHGDTDGVRSIANEEFFTRLGQATARLLHTPTVDGFVFRVDMRLRPFGDSGPLVASFASFEDYLQRHGRDWERYAYIKARPITAVDAYAEIYRNAVRPFVYRRYIDYGVFESLREMKQLIEREVERREMADHVKLGPGGIREVEFIVQAFQLIRGGRQKSLQTPRLLEALPQLDGDRLLPAEVVTDLHAAYTFLRRLENRLQILADQQTHQLPKDDLSRERIALAMDLPDWSALLAQLDVHRKAVLRHFQSVVFSRESDTNAVRVDLGRFWDTPEEQSALAESLQRAGFTEATEVARLLLELRGSALVRKLDDPGRRRLQALLPLLMTDIAASSSQLVVLRRVLRIIEAIGQRSVYFALLHESGYARRGLIELCARGEFLAKQIAAHPLLLDELIDERASSEVPSRATLAHDLVLVMQQLAEDDPERQVEALCHFQQAAFFRIAVSDLAGRLPIMKVSDRLTDVAELIVERAMELGWRQIVQQFGVPMCGEGSERRAVRIAAAGYGKLGGMELGYSSDLDLVFLHDSIGERQETDAARPLDNQVFFIRLAQRMVHLLTMHSRAGRLYEVDVRLRPSGKGGMLVTSIHAFADYQRKEAWTWEHQALLHARAVAGASEVRTEFERVRLDVLQHNVRRETLRDEVRSMRERMRKELSKARPGQFDIKQDAGGVADIEFLAQYWALEWARDYPPVAMFSDTIRQLESVASADLVPQATVDVLTATYRAYRTRTHHLSLEDRSPIVGAEEFVDERAAVTRIWDETLVEPRRV
jgi:[glutamine synthetase] adenylyltransferase / [glutamine synthetase]-adenylyl-L-tyrosine phosphorylase